jgi:hypothetical protein
MGRQPSKDEYLTDAWKDPERAEYLAYCRAKGKKPSTFEEGTGTWKNDRR